MKSDTNMVLEQIFRTLITFTEYLSVILPTKITAQQGGSQVTDRTIYTSVAQTHFVNRLVEKMVLQKSRPISLFP